MQQNFHPAPVFSGEATASWFRPMPRHSLDQVCCMGALPERLREEAHLLDPNSIFFDLLPMGKFRSYLLYGPPGTAKSYLALAFVRELMQMGYAFVSLRAEDLRACSEPQRQTLAAAAFREASGHAPCVILVEDLEQFCRSRSGAEPGDWKQTVEFLTACNALRDTPAPIVFIGCTDKPWLVDCSLMDKSQTIRIPYPGAEDRRAFFSLRLGDLPFGDDLSMEELVSVSENRDFRELTALARALAQASGGRALSRSMLEEALEAHPATDKSQVLRDLEAFETFNYE